MIPAPTGWPILAKHSVESVGQVYPDVKETDVGPVSMVTWKAAGWVGKSTAY